MSRAPSPNKTQQASQAVNRRLVKFLSRPLILEEAGPPRAMTHLLLICSLAVGGFIAWSTVTDIKETALVQGQIIPAGSVHTVQHLEGGIVQEILVENGQVVERGQPVLRLQETTATSELDRLRAKEVGLALRAERLRAFVLGEAPDFSSGGAFPSLRTDQQAILETQRRARESQRAVLLSRIEQRKAELRSLFEQRKSLKNQNDIISQQLEMRRDLLDKGLVSRIDFLESERALVESLGRLSALESDALGTREALNEAENALVELDASLGNDALDEMGEVSAELAQVREELRKLEDRVVRLDIVAPAKGVVKGLVIRTVGAVIGPADVLMEIVPFDDVLVAEVQVQPKDIGHLWVGQEAAVKVNTYDVSRFGTVAGTVQRISASTFQTEEGAPFYRAIITLSQNHVGSIPGRNLILPGMVVDADITTGNRSLFRYLLKPIYRSLDVAFSER